MTAIELCAGVHVLHDEAVELAESVLFMRQKLEETRELLEDQSIVIPYDNGGGQCGIRENPHFLAYERLLAAYNKALKQLGEILDKGAPVRNTSNIMQELSVIAGKKIG